MRDTGVGAMRFSSMADLRELKISIRISTMLILGSMYDDSLLNDD